MKKTWVPPRGAVRPGVKPFQVPRRADDYFPLQRRADDIHPLQAMEAMGLLRCPKCDRVSVYGNPDWAVRAAAEAGELCLGHGS